MSLPLHQQVTLESSGLMYDPFNSTSIFGTLPSIQTPEIATNPLPKTADVSALPQFSHPSYVTSRFAQGAAAQPEWKNNRDRRTQLSGENSLYLVAFVAVLAVALFVNVQ